MSDHVLTELNALQSSHCQRDKVLAPQQCIQGPCWLDQLINFQQCPAILNFLLLAEATMFPWALVT